MDQFDTSVRLKQVYSELDRKFEEQETQRKAKQLNIPYLNLYGMPIDPAALGLVAIEQAKNLRIVVFYKEGPHIKVGVVVPSKPVEDFIASLKQQGLSAEVYMISESSFNRALSEYSKVFHVEHKSSDVKISKIDNKYIVGSLKQLADRLGSTSTTELIESIIGGGLSLDASDVHLEPEANGVKVRYRLDGVLQDIALLPKESHHALLSRIKILSKLKLNITAKPQDGSFSLTYNNVHIDLRVSVLPSAFGESVVLRILRQDQGSLKFEELGISTAANEVLLKEIRKPNGMIITTGPTGSGKTTTLYAVLNLLNQPGVKIITLEDPVEYKLEGITQTPVGGSTGLAFADGLRAILRQDPDVVMVGEMRDLETAETAAQAALTGHIVLSTLHTNDAAGAIPRLLDLGVKPFVLAPAINAVVAQRLVRRICQYCKGEYTPATKIVERVKMILKDIPAASKVKIPKELTFYHSPGCEKCNGLGYKGRIGVYEIFTVNEQVEKLIHEQASSAQIRKQAILDGMVTMAQDGIFKAMQGITDVEEVFRVTEE